MAKKRKLYSPITILMIVCVIAALATWLVPAGRYNTLSYTKKSFFLNTDSGRFFCHSPEKRWRVSILKSVRKSLKLEL
jgi:uncharacterized ion transporter superfamily protein YfcC